MLLPTLVSLSLGPLLVVARVCHPKYSHAPSVSYDYSHLPSASYGYSYLPSASYGYSTAQGSEPTCFTVSGTGGNYGPLETKTSTVDGPAVTLTSTQTTTVLTTVTPQTDVTTTATITVTVTTTDLAVTGTFTSTITETSTLSFVDTTTTTVSTTTTTTETTTETATSTIPTPAGFTPVYESSGYTSQGQMQRRNVLAILRGRSLPQCRADTAEKKPLYVKCVTTNQPTSTVTTTYIITSTETAPTSTSTLSTTETSTTTSTVIPFPVTSTVSTTTTVTTSTTSTITDTTTTTLTATTTTTTTTTTSFYAACATNNILGPQVAENGLYVQGVGNSDANGFQVTVSAASAYECCVICITGSAITNCQNAIYVPESGTCNPIGSDGDTCVPGSTAAGSYVLLSNSPFNRFDMNGPCGSLGPDPTV